MWHDNDFVGHGHDTPEEAALASYSQAAAARVLSVTIDGDEATVHTEVSASTGYAVTELCHRHRGRWFNVGHCG
ncbi:MAG: hypothetical protein WDA60_10885 [Acidimicrobiia bacterium]